MSIALIDTVWCESKLSGAELVLMLALADYAGQDGWCNPNIDSLANKCHVSVVFLEVLIRRCVASGELSCPPRGGYQINIGRFASSQA